MNKKVKKNQKFELVPSLITSMTWGGVALILNAILFLLVWLFYTERETLSIAARADLVDIGLLIFVFSTCVSFGSYGRLLFKYGNIAEATKSLATGLIVGGVIFSLIDPLEPVLQQIVGAKSTWAAFKQGTPVWEGFLFGVSMAAVAFVVGLMNDPDD